MLIANLLGGFVFIYIFWKKLKEDYHFEKIFNLTFILLFCFLGSLLLSNFVLLNFRFWIILVTMFLCLLVAIRRQKMNFFESIDAFIIACLPWLSFVYLHSTVSTESLPSFVGFWLTLICIFIYLFINSTYKNFVWYKSGKVGIAGIITAIFFFLFRTISSLILPNMAYLSGTYEIYMSLSGSLLFIILLYNLMRIKE